MPSGKCLCSAVRFEVDGPLAEPEGCHCSQCRRQSGHFWVSTDVARDRLTLHGQEHLTWYRSSARIRRGFCRHCGSALFWDADGRDQIAIGMGAFDA
ncbi:MAG: GFA family protein, partial [Allosphingosinicella sp.]